MGSDGKVFLLVHGWFKGGEEWGNKGKIENSRGCGLCTLWYVCGRTGGRVERKENEVGKKIHKRDGFIE